MNFVLISDEKKFFEGDVSEISSISEDGGPLTILQNHIPFLAKIKDFVLFTRISDNGSERHDISEGFLYTNGTVCFAVVETKPMDQNFMEEHLQDR